MSAVASQISGVSFVCLTLGACADQRKHQSAASLTFVREMHRWPVNSPHKRPVTWKIFPFDDIIMSLPYYPMRHLQHNSRTNTTYITATLKSMLLTHWGRDKNGRHFPNDILKCIFLNKNVWISNTIWLKFVVLNRPVDNIPALGQIIAWRRPGDKSLSEPLVSFLTHLCFTRPQWDKY